MSKQINFEVPLEIRQRIYNASQEVIDYIEREKGVKVTKKDILTCGLLHWLTGKEGLVESLRKGSELAKKSKILDAIIELHSQIQEEKDSV